MNFLARLPSRGGSQKLSALGKTGVSGGSEKAFEKSLQCLFVAVGSRPEYTANLNNLLYKIVIN